MKKYLRLFLIGLLFVACTSTPFRYNYLINPIDGFYESNLRYPNDLDKYIQYLEKFQHDFESGTGESLPIYEDFLRYRDHLTMSQNDSLIFIIYRTDTIDSQYKRTPCNYNELSLNRWNLRPFLRVVMHTDASPYNNIASEETMGQFNQGLYNIIVTYIPEFQTHLKDRDTFNVALLYSEKGQLQKFCQDEQLDMNTDIMKSIASYVDEYMTQNCLSKIFFYYIYY